jgi:hypothetical protein
MKERLSVVAKRGTAGSRWVMTKMGFHGASAIALVAGAGLLAATAGPAQATITTQPFSVDTSGTLVEPLSFSQFDTSLGTLTGVKFTLSNSVTTEVSTFAVTGGEGSGSATMSATFEITGPGQGGPHSLQLFNGTGSASSSCNGFSGGGSGTCVSSGNDTTVPPSFTNPKLVNTAADFVPYEGAGNFVVDVALTGPVLNDTCTSLGAAPTCTDGGRATWAGDLTVDFLFNPAPPPSDVPEPSSLSLFMLGIVGFAGFRQWRRKRR